MEIKNLENVFSAKELKDYFFITIAMLFYCIGWTIFLLSNNITASGAPGISSVLYWGLGIPAQYSYLFINAVLVAFALRSLGLRFCIKIIFGIIILTTLASLAQTYTLDVRLLNDQPFMASVIGAAFCGTGVGLGLSANGNTGSTDIVTIIVNKYRNISLGRAILICGLMIISSSYPVLYDWEKVIRGYAALFITPFCVNWVVNSMCRPMQFFTISDRYEEIGRQINENSYRGCTVVNAPRSYLGREMKMLFVLTKKNESGKILDLINDIDPAAFVSQSVVIEVYGEGSDRFRVKQRKDSPDKSSQKKQGNSNP